MLKTQFGRFLFAINFGFTFLLQAGALRSLNLAPSQIPNPKAFNNPLVLAITIALFIHHYTSQLPK